MKFKICNIAIRKVGLLYLFLNLKNKHEKMYFDEQLVIDEIIIQHTIEKDYIVLDVGANVGYETTLFIKNGAKKVYAYEPTNLFYRLKFLSMQNYQIMPIKKALSNYIGKAEINLSQTHNQGHSLKEKWIQDWPDVFLIQGKKKTKLIEVSTLDNENIKERISYIKLDIEGSELDFLNGSYEYFSKYGLPDYLQVELYKDEKEAFCMEATRLFQYGYRCVVNHDNKLVLIDLDNSANLEKYKIYSPPTYLFFNSKSLSKMQTMIKQ